MSKTITIDPVTRIEGHAKITIQLDDEGRVADAMFHVTQFRGFEKFVEGRPLREMPAIMARICGICPVSHLMASAKACDDLLAVEIPPIAAHLRRIMNLGQLVLEVERLVGRDRVSRVNRADGEMITPDQILRAIQFKQ